MTRLHGQVLSPANLGALASFLGACRCSREGVRRLAPMPMSKSYPPSAAWSSVRLGLIGPLR